MTTLIVFISLISLVLLAILAEYIPNKLPDGNIFKIWWRQNVVSDDDSEEF